MRVLTAVCLISLCVWAAVAVCQKGCVCTNNVCDSCQTGYFNGNTDLTGTPQCWKCPIGCLTCDPRSDGSPACTACDNNHFQPWQIWEWEFDDAEGKCYFCDKSCQSCTGPSPNQCRRCIESYVFIPDAQDNTVGSCIEDKYCPSLCLNCTGTDALREAEANGQTITNQMIDTTVFCDGCPPTFFLIANSCVKCPHNSLHCFVDADDHWTLIDSAWRAIIAQIPQQQQPAYNPISDLEKNIWTIAFYLFKYMDPTMSNQTIVLAGFAQFSSIASIARPFDHWDALTIFVNQVTQQQKTVDQVKNGIIALYQAAATLAWCEDGLKPNAEQNACVRCDSSCRACGEYGCTKCKPGFFLYNEACTACDPTCQTCQGAATTCTSCLLPLSLTSAKTCVQCADPCKTCDPSSLTTCILCKKPFSVEANNGVCLQCSDPVCLKCDSTDLAICLSCQPGYINLDGVCKSCMENCVACSADAAVCFVCKLSFVMHEGQCQQCPIGCEFCSKDPTLCEACGLGYQLNFDTRKCDKCQEGCAKCDEGRCYERQAGVAVYNGEVVPCDPGCYSCDSQNPRVCYECKDKFYLDGSLCKSCKPGCEECADGASCVQCREGTYDNSGSCEKCGDGCKECSSPTACSTCFRGYTLDNTNTCVRSCASSCAVCDPSNNAVCKECKKGYALKISDSSCVKCARKCSGSCNPTNTTLCTFCSEGFMLVDSDCIRCPDGCTTCSEGNCLTCRPGMTLQTVNSKDVCVQACPSPCKTCSAGKCLTCIIGYKVSNGACVLDTANLCTTDCAFCPQGTELTNANACQACSVANCTTCVGGVCTACWSSTYIDSTANPPSCQPCAAECKTCFDAITCDECADGYYHELVSMVDGIDDAVFSDACSLCDDNCATCFLESTRCLSCKEGYRLGDGNACLGRYEVRIAVKFDVAYADFIVDGLSQTFLQQVATFLGVDITRVDLISVTEGSTEVVSSVSTSGADEAATIQSSASDTTAMVGSVGTILSSSVGVTYDGEDIQEEKEEKNKSSKVGLIVGVVIGSVVLLAIVGFLVYKFANKSNDSIRVNEGSSNVIMEDGKHGEKIAYA